MRTLALLLSLFASAPALAQLDLVPQAGLPSAELAFSPDGKLLYAGDGSVWDTESGMMLRRLGLPAGMIALSSDGAILAHEPKRDYAKNQRTIAFIDTRTGATAGSYVRDDDGGHLVFGPDGGDLLRISAENTRLIRRDGSQVAREENRKGESGFTGAFLDKSNVVVVFRRDNNTSIARVLGPTLKGDQSFEVPGLTTQVSSAGDGRLILLQGEYVGGQLWDAKEGKLVRKLPIPGGTETQSPVALSPGGKLAAGRDGERAYRSVFLFDTEGQKPPIKIDLDAEETTSGALSWGVAFSPDGKLLAFGSTAHGVAIADVATGRVRKVLGKARLDAYALGFSADGRYLAVAGEESGQVHIWNLAEGRMETFIHHANTLEKSAWIDRVAIDAKGELVAVQGRKSVFVYERRTQKLLATMPGDSNTGLGLASSGEFLITAPRVNDKVPTALVLWDPRTGKEQSRIELSSSHRAFALSPDDRTIAIGGDGKVDFYSITDKAIVRTERLERPMARYQQGPVGFPLFSWGADGNAMLVEEDPALYATRLGVTQGNVRGKFGTLWYFWNGGGRIQPFMGQKVGGSSGNWAAIGGENGELVLFSGTEGWDRSHMRSHRANSYVSWQRQAHAGKVAAVAFDPGNGSVFASAGGDVKLWSTKDRGYATLIARGNEWIIITDDGYFDGSKNGGDLIAMVQHPRAFGVDQFAIRNNRPDLILSRFGLGDADALAHYKLQHERRVRKAGLTEEALAFDLKVPEAAIEPGEVSGRRLTLKLSCKDAASELKSSTIFVNDVPVIAAKPLSGKSADWSDSIMLSAGRNKIELSCTNQSGSESFRALREVEGPAAAKPNLYFLGFGVSRYAEKKLALQYAANDATDLGKVFGKMKGAFASVKVKTLLDQQVTAAAIAKAKDFFASAKEDDVAVLFIAGHGVHGEGSDATYYYLTHETNLADLAGTSAPFELVEDLLRDIAPRQKLFLMDTCESGELDGAQASGVVVASADSRAIRSRAVRGIRVKPAEGATQPAPRPYLLSRDRFIFNDLARRTGAIVFSSSRGGEYSYESAQLKNGLFTRALLTAFTSAAADGNKDGKVTTDELRAYVSEEVPRLAKGLQHPTVDRDNLTARFSFPIVKR